MRKKTVNHLADTIFWYLLYFLPIILALVMSIGAFQSDYISLWYTEDGDNTNLVFYMILEPLLSNFGVIMRGGIIYDSLVAIFGESGLLPIFHDFSPILDYFSYFVGVYLIHLMVDFILFIPRLAHKWMNAFTRSE